MKSIKKGITWYWKLTLWMLNSFMQNLLKWKTRRVAFVVLANVEVVVVNITPRFKTLNPLPNDAKYLKQSKKWDIYLVHNAQDCAKDLKEFRRREIRGCHIEWSSKFMAVVFRNQVNQLFGNLVEWIKFRFEMSFTFSYFLHKYLYVDQSKVVVRYKEIFSVLMYFLVYQMRGALGFHGLRVWPILAIGFRDFSEKRAGFRVLDAARVTGFAIFLARVSGIVIKMCGFSGFRWHTGSQFSKGQWNDSTWCAYPSKKQIFKSWNAA